jgi:uncharacterized iron-regulated membrane protein
MSNTKLHSVPVTESEPAELGHKAAASLRFARFSRRLHKWAGVFLALVAVVLSITGGFTAYKTKFEYLQPAGRVGAKGDIANAIPPSKVAEIILSMNMPEARELKQINRIELRPKKRMYKVRLEAAGTWSLPREIQIDAMTGAVLNDGLRGDELWMDIHSFAVFGEITKLITMTLAGLSLLWLSLSGFYLFFYPIWFKAHKRQKLEQQDSGRDIQINAA